MQVYEAATSDAEEIARLHVSVWCKTYKSLAPAEVHAALGIGFRTEQWLQLLSAEPPISNVILAKDGSELVGFCCGGPSSNTELNGRGEIKSLYVSAAHHGQGIGRKLFSMMADQLVRAGHSRIALSVVEGNSPAIEFYEHLGGQLGGRFIDPGPIWKSTNLIYVWDNVAGLTK